MRRPRCTRLDRSAFRGRGARVSPVLPRGVPSGIVRRAVSTRLGLFALAAVAPSLQAWSPGSTGVRSPRPSLSPCSSMSASWPSRWVVSETSIPFTNWDLLHEFASKPDPSFDPHPRTPSSGGWFRRIVHYKLTATLVLLGRDSLIPKGSKILR